MADRITLPFGIQSEYDRLVMRGGPTPQLIAAHSRIAHFLALRPHWFEAVTAEVYAHMDGGYSEQDNNTTEEEFYNGTS
jgi:hypothetical protein